MPQCPSCLAEMDYDAMMRHDARRCRGAAERVIEAALLLDGHCGERELPPDTDGARAAWANLRESVKALYAARMRTDA